MSEKQPERNGRRPADGERPQRSANGERPRRTADGERPRRTADGERTRRAADGERPRRPRTDDAHRTRRAAEVAERPVRRARPEGSRAVERSAAQSQRSDDAKKKTIIRSAAAVAVIVLFLIVGKIFFWNQDSTKNTQGNEVSVAEVGVTTTTEITTTTAETTTVTTTEATAEVHFETYPLTAGDADASTQTQAVTDADAAQTEAVTTEAAATGFPVNAPEGYFNDALFIGDSRTVGQACFGPIEGATYFATVGLATYKIDEAVSEVPGTDGMSFADALAMKQFTKVYIMLGINELGNDLNMTMNNFKNLIARIQQAQPNAVIIIEANLHVSAIRHNSDALVNNTVINSFNAGLAQFADNNKIYYIDVNPVFDDANGCLTAEYTSDGTHPYANQYANWADFIRKNAVVK
ncbi:MAG: GDSL-type esterase/lipase family protein [Oscillospiraceae bacterium]|nr:GDSL-type esterase/lipase family protein [Oscillospiraceae bacterium]